ncbi:tripartite tricarboxylate transporter substrate binding protein [Caballeronia mineralivorans]|nr:tripartite tricarboxylate transporter substrate binding protein [Caballeronia mineralivorans]
MGKSSIRSAKLRGAVLLSCTVLLCMQTLTANAADTWQPHRPIEIVVPSAPGGGLDLVGRTLQSVIQQDKLSSKPVTVINRPGGGGTVGIAYINSHSGDGHYVSVQALPLITNRVTGLSTVGVDDVTPLAVFVTEPVVFAVAADGPIKNGKDLVAMLHKDPSAVSMAVSSSPGGQSHAAAALVLKAVGQDPKKLKIVFFDSGGEAVTSLMGGHVTASATPAGVVLGPSQAGRVKMIGIPSDVRQAGDLANVPTWKEQGVDAEFSTWRVLVGPKDMTAAEIAWWDDVLKKATASPEWAAAVKRNLWTADYKDSADTKVFLAGEQKRLTSLLTDLGLAK